jgi:DNA-directed RNA polymerase subunit RPC12/RpoP
MKIPPDVLSAIESASYICSMCKQKVYPSIDNVDFKEETISLSNDMYDFRGGLGDKVLADHVCPECAKKCHMGANID